MCVENGVIFESNTERERRRKEREREKRTNWQTKKKHTSIHNSQTHSEKGRVGLGSLLSLSLSSSPSIYKQKINELLLLLLVERWNRATRAGKQHKKKESLADDANRGRRSEALLGFPGRRTPARSDGSIGFFFFLF